MTDKGTLVFDGEVNQEELDFIIEAGLVYMVQHNMLPFTSNEGVVMGDDTLQ